MRDWVYCSLGQPSQCTFRVVRNYFVDGIVPEKGLSFSAEYNAFDPLTAYSEGDISFGDIARVAELVKKF